VTLVQRGDLKGRLKNFSKESYIKKIITSLSDLHNKFRRNTFEVDKEMRSEITKTMLSAAKNSEDLTSEQIQMLQKCEKLKGGSQAIWEEIRWDITKRCRLWLCRRDKDGPDFIPRMGGNNMIFGDKGALRGKAQVVIDCAPEHAAAWLFDLNSCGRTRKAKEYNSQEDRIVVGNVDRDREVRLSEERMDEMGMIPRQASPPSSLKTRSLAA